jgi:predicted aspartyl protease
MPGPLPYQPGFGIRPAPACDVTISWQGSDTVVPALIDSGADSTTIPEAVVHTLALRKRGEIPVSGAIGGHRTCGVYVVDLNFLGWVFRAHPVVALPNRDFALIGRDILNFYTATLAGPPLEFSVV